MKGCICLDIDGTLTSDPHKIPSAVIELLHKLHEEGWEFLFITGRFYSFAAAVLREIRFPYFFSLQNGADLLWMPEKKSLFQKYLSVSCLPLLEEISSEVQEDFILYTGWEKGDFCYYRPQKFSSDLLTHLERIKPLSEKPWQAKDSFSFAPEESFSLIKFFGSKEEMFSLHDVVAKANIGEVTCIKDPMSEQGLYLNLLTGEGVSKGGILRKMRSLFPKNTLFIAAGDDLNDITMLQEADIAIAMENAPPALLAEADIIAPSAEKKGILRALIEVTSCGNTSFFLE